jgi:hypothetical protein
VTIRLRFPLPGSRCKKTTGLSIDRIAYN